MPRRLTFALAGLAAAASLACQSDPRSAPPKKSGPAVAKGDGIVITAEEFKARLDEQSPFIRARYTTLERKKEFLDNQVIRFEVLAREAERQGLQNDPDVQNTMKKIMVQKLVQKRFQDPASGPAELPEAELQAYYDAHRADYFRPKKVRLSAVIVSAPEAGADRAKRKDLARKALAKIRAEEKRNATAFQAAVAEFSDDAASRAIAGDLSFKSHDELARAYAPAVADAVFALAPGQTSEILEAPGAFLVVRVTGVQEELNRPFEQVKGQIANKLFREKKTKEFDAWLASLREQAKIVVDEKVLEAVEVSAAPAGSPAPHGMGGPRAMPLTGQNPH